MDPTWLVCERPERSARLRVFRRREERRHEDDLDRSTRRRGPPPRWVYDERNDGSDRGILIRDLIRDHLSVTHHYGDSDLVR